MQDVKFCSKIGSFENFPLCNHFNLWIILFFKDTYELCTIITSNSQYSLDIISLMYTVFNGII